MRKESQQQIADTESESSSFDLQWWIGCAAITLIATFLRFFEIGLKPFHHDEGVNGWFLTTLFRDGMYKYDPANYHGPTLYYISLAFTKVFGLETLPVRWSVAVWGVFMVVLAFWIKRYIGRIGSLFAALLLALSPGMVFISRYYIHEIFFVFLAFAVVVSIVLFIEREKAGPFALAWTGLILLVCFVPAALRLAALIADAGTTAILALQIGFFLIELILVIFVLRMLAAWHDGRPLYFLLASASVSLMFGTKETGFISLGTMLIAIICVLAWGKIISIKSLAEKPLNRLMAVLFLPVLTAAYYYETVLAGLKWFFDHIQNATDHSGVVRYGIAVLTIYAAGAFVIFIVQAVREPEMIDDYDSPSWIKFNNGLGSGIDLVLILLGALAVFIYIWVLFFTSFFTFAEGVGRSIEAYNIWTKTGSKDHTQNGAFGYLKWGIEIEAPLIIISALGLLIAFFKGKHRFALFSGLWAFGLFLGYSIIPYKTPWLMLSFLLPMAITAGYAINELAKSKNWTSRISAIVLAAVGCVVLALQAYDLNFAKYDDDRMPYIYAHTNREYPSMLAAIDSVAKSSGQDKQTKIQIITPDYWPLVWDLRNYPNAVFHGRIAEADKAELIIAKKNGQEAETLRKYSGEYDYFGSYKLRPGVDLVLYVRKDLIMTQN